jgi:hypothetical protein
VIARYSRPETLRIWSEELRRALEHLRAALEELLGCSIRSHDPDEGALLPADALRRARAGFTGEDPVVADRDARRLDLEALHRASPARPRP